MQLGHLSASLRLLSYSVSGQTTWEAWPDSPLLVQPLNPAQNSTLPLLPLPPGLHLILGSDLHFLDPHTLMFPFCLHLKVPLMSPVTRWRSPPCFFHSICFTLLFCTSAVPLGRNHPRSDSTFPYFAKRSRRSGQGADLRTRPGPNPPAPET